MTRFITTLVLLCIALPATAQPNERAAVEACVTRYPAAWACAHTGRACSADFVILCARDLSAKDVNWGVNGKRGNPDDLSQDILAYRGTGTAVDVTRGNTPMEIIDVIACAGGDPPRCSPSVEWGVAPGGKGDRGAWVDPWRVQPTAGGTAPPAPTPQPPPAPTPPPVDLRPVLDKLAGLEAVLVGIGLRLEAIEALSRQAAAESLNAAVRASDIKDALAARPNTDWPEYVGTVSLPGLFGGQRTVVMRPREGGQ